MDCPSPCGLQPRSGTLRLPSVCLFKRFTTWTPFYGWQQIETKFSLYAPKSNQGILQHWYTASYSTLVKVCWKWRRLCGKIATKLQHIWIIDLSFIVIATAFTEKIIRGISFISPLVYVVSISLRRELETRPEEGALRALQLLCHVHYSKRNSWNCHIFWKFVTLLPLKTRDITALSVAYRFLRNKKHLHLSVKFLSSIQ
jgi:hypothetical protein